MSRTAIIKRQVVDVKVLKRFSFFVLVQYEAEWSVRGKITFTANKAKWIPVWKLIEEAD